VGRAYEPAEWHEFGLGVGGASAAFLGLLFVAVSINRETLLGDDVLRRRAESVLVGFLGVFVATAALLVPQGRIALGTEIVSLAVVCAFLGRQWAVAFSEGRARMGIDVRLRWGLARLGLLLVLAGGVSLLAAAGGGIYLLAGGLLLVLTSAADSAWSLFVSIA